MKKIVVVIILAVSLSLALGSVAGAYPRGWHGGPYWGWYGFGPWWGFPYAYPYYGYPYYPYAYTYPEYQPAAPSAPSESQPFYWYYCRDPQGYYPYVQSCHGGWTQVVPKPSHAGNEGGTK
jgi:hypothetical protein